MREFPVTVPSHVYGINSSASNLYEDDHYHRKSTKIESDINCGRLHRTAAAQQWNNKNAANYICTSNSDLTSFENGRLHNFTNINNINNNNCNRSLKIVIKSGNDKNDELFDERDRSENVNGNRVTGGNAAYSIFDAITNAVTTGHCVNTVYPKNDQRDADFDQINLISPDSLPTSTSVRNLKNAPSHMNNECGKYQQQPQHKYHLNNSRAHRFPSSNYKHSYLLWIATPVAAR